MRRTRSTPLGRTTGRMTTRMTRTLSRMTVRALGLLGRALSAMCSALEGSSVLGGVGCWPCAVPGGVRGAGKRSGAAWVAGRRPGAGARQQQGWWRKACWGLASQTCSTAPAPPPPGTSSHPPARPPARRVPAHAPGCRGARQGQGPAAGAHAARPRPRPAPHAVAPHAQSARAAAARRAAPAAPARARGGHAGKFSRALAAACLLRLPAGLVSPTSYFRRESLG